MKKEIRGITEQVKIFLSPMLNKPCCRQRVWRGKTLSLGFGKKVYHGNPKLVDDFYGEWEIGTYFSSWRVIKKDKILCASNDTVDSPDELDAVLQQIKLGHICSINQPTKFDIRAEFDNGIFVEFLATTSDEDESFHIFAPQNLCATFSIMDGWVLGRSDKPPK